ncbi:MAG: phytanoyl-CoA dioxygenase family protein [bacterium]|nr:phytanoyl-CoA dioxygenase family protein [bacterium]
MNSNLELQPLSEVERSQLDEQGFLCLGQLLSESQLESARNRVAELLSQEGDQAGSELYDSPYIRHPKESGADRLANLVNKGSVFEQFFLHPRLLAAVSCVLGDDFRLSSLNYRAARPGTGEQMMHVDWHEAVAPGDYRVCNSIWLLDDFTAENGATRFVPKSHWFGQTPAESMTDVWAAHPEEDLLEAPAGTVVLFNAHLWHGGTTNRTGSPRRAIHSYFCRGDQPQQTDQKRFLTEETAKRLSPEALRILIGGSS